MNLIERIIAVFDNDEIYKLLITILIGIIIYNFVSIIVEKIITTGKTEFDRKKRKTIVDLFKNIFKYIIILTIIIFVLNLYGYNVRTLVAGLGIAATVLGLALQDTIKDFISGITIIMENYYVTGDIVRYNEFTGEVIELTLKSTKIKAHSGEVLIISNRNVDQVVNLSQKGAKVSVNIPMPYEADIEKTEKIITEQIIPECKKIKEVDSKDIQYIGIDAIQDSSISYVVSVGCRQENRWKVKREVLRTIIMVLKKNKISIPYNKIEVINAKNKTK